MRKKLVLALVTVAAFGLFAFSMVKKRQQVIPQTCPFDSNLSVGLAFEGPHFYFHTDEIQDTILNARFAWFQPDEAPNPIFLNSRIVQGPPEEDWVWWETRFPTTLLVQITDSLNRLGKVEVWDLDREILVGELKATPDGSAINGTLILNEPTSFWLVNIKDKDDKILAKLLAKNPKVVLHAVIVYANWIPHPPPRVGANVTEIKKETHIHPVEVWDKKTGELKTEDWDCIVKYFQVECHPGLSIVKEQHIATKGVEERILTPPPQGCSVLDTRSIGCGAWVEITRGEVPPTPLLMTRRYTNDSKEEDPNVLPPHDYRLRTVIHKAHIDTKVLNYLTETARKYVQEEVLDFQGKEEIIKVDGKEINLDKTSPFIPAKVKPYSESCIHWGEFNAIGRIRAIYVYPEVIGERPEFTVIQTLLNWIGFRINQSKHPMTFFLFEGFRRAWEEYISQKEEIRKAGIKPKDLQFYGDVWVVYVNPGRPTSPVNPMIHFERNLTQDVKIQIVVVKPDGTEEAIEGSVCIERLEPSTTPSPPDKPLPPESVNVPKQGTTVALGKGWKWKISTNPSGQQQVSVVIEVPPTTSVTIKVPAPQQPHSGQPPGGQPPGGQPPGGQPPNG